MRHPFVPAVALLLAGCSSSQLASDLRTAHAPCEDQKFPNKSAFVACLNETERPVWARESPETLDAYESFAKRRTELASEYDRGAIDDSRYKADLARSAADARADIARRQSAAAPD
jgi:hypothetical protein